MPNMRRELSPTTALPTWMALNGVQTNGVQIQDLDPKSSRGVVATAEAEDEGHLFVDVPSSLVLSVDTAWAHAKHDRHLREVLEANGEFAKVWFLRGVDHVHANHDIRSLREELFSSFSSYKYA